MFAYCERKTKNKNKDEKFAKMSDRAKKRAAISALLRVGKTVKGIVDNVGCSRALVDKVKNRVRAGKSLQVLPRKRNRPTLTPRVVEGLRHRIQCALT